MFRRGLLLFVLVSALIGAGWVAGVIEQSVDKPLLLDEALELDVPRGASLQGVLNGLHEQGQLQDRFWLRLWLRLNERGDHIQAGEYLVGPGTTVNELIAMLEAGRVRTWSVTLVEGWTLQQAREVLRSSPRLGQEVADVPADRLLAALGVDADPGRSPEGRFFPDTYVFSGRTTDRDILLQAYRRMEAVLAAEWAQRAEGLPYQSPADALVMASIVERETGVASERDEIAGVFVRRLQRGMRLQTDPTVIYGLGQTYEGNLRRSHLRDDSNPYNTYARAGLPPTPIALPGRAAIHAALHPKDGDSLYFVAKGDGSHYFSATLEEHNKAVRRYQIEQRRADYRSRPAMEQQK